VKQLRRAVAERDSFKAAFEEQTRQKEAWKISAESWQSLFESEKRRADETQGARIAALEKTVDELGKANFQYRQQTDADRRHISEQNAQIIRLKSARKWYFLSGFGTGFAAGGFTGYQVRGKINF
jgi:hypothetical protein